MFLRNNYGLNDADVDGPKEFPDLRRLSSLSDPRSFRISGYLGSLVENPNPDKKESVRVIGVLHFQR